MSNFSQYFPIGGSSSGGDGGGGINSYAPFKVTATDNPVGYNATTGLYTNPVDGSVFLKTGQTLVLTTDDYPNANRTEGIFDLANLNYPQINNYGGYGTNDAANEIYVNGVTDNTVFVYSGLAAGGTLGPALRTISYASYFAITPTGNNGRIVYDGTTLWIFRDNNYVGINPSTGVQTIAERTSTLPAGTSISVYSVGFNPNTGYAYFGRGGSNAVAEFDLTNNTVIQQFSLNATEELDSVWYDTVRNKFWAFNSRFGNDTIEDYDLTWTRGTETVTPPSSNDTIFFMFKSTGWWYITSNFNESQLKIKAESYTYGDGTTRTSAMGDGQPLFIKLK